VSSNLITRFQELNMGLAVANDVQIKRLPGCRIEATIRLDPEAVQAAKKKAIREVSKEISLPGFRKGRVPEDLVEQRFAGNIDKEMRKQVSITAWELVMKAEKIKPLRNGIQGRIQSCSLDEGAELHYQIDHEPIVPQIPLEDVKLKTLEPITVTDQEIDDFLQRIARWAGQSEETDLVAEGTAVSIELAWADQEPAQKFADRELTPVDQLPAWLVTALMGKKAGDTVTLPWGDTPIDDEQLVPQGRPCLITLKLVHKLIDHPIDDALATKVGADNLEQLRERARQRIAGQKRHEEHKLRRLEVREQLLKLVQFDVPQSVIETTFASVQKDEPATAGQTEESVRSEIMDGVKLAYLSEALLRQFGQTVRYQDVMAKVQEMAPPWADHQKLMQDLLQDEQSNARLTSTVMVEKALDCVLERISTVDKK
jgi:trigger factor